MQTSDKPIANPICVLREEFDDWAVLFNPDTAEAVGINPVGVAAWKLMDGSRTLDDIVAAICDEFDDVPDSALAELRQYVEMLAENGFVGYEVLGDEP